MDNEILSILACPKCLGTLNEATAADILSASSTQKVEQGLCCPQCGLLYPIENTIPVLLTDAAIPLAGAPINHSDEQ